MAKRGPAAHAPAPSTSSGVERAHELFKQGRSKEALAILRPMLQRKGQVDGDIAALAAELEPTRASAHYNIARIAARMGDKSKAIDHFARAVEIQSDYVDRLDEDLDLRPLQDDPGMIGRLPGAASSEDPYAEYYATR